MLNVEKYQFRQLDADVYRVISVSAFVATKRHGIFVLLVLEVSSECSVLFKVSRFTIKKSLTLNALNSFSLIRVEKLWKRCKNTVRMFGNANFC